MTVISILVAAFCGFLICLNIRLHPEEPQCPAGIFGDRCKTELGKTCDHSKLAVLEAQVAMEKNRLEAESIHTRWRGPLA